MPYEHKANNQLEIILSMALFCQICMASGAGFEAPNLGDEAASTFKGNGAMWFLGVSYIGMGIPVFWIGIQAMLIFDCVHDLMPVKLRSLTNKEFEAKRVRLIEQLKSFDNMKELIKDMDRIEFANFFRACTKPARAPLHITVSRSNELQGFAFLTNLDVRDPNAQNWRRSVASLVGKFSVKKNRLSSDKAGEDNVSEEDESYLDSDFQSEVPGSEAIEEIASDKPFDDETRSTGDDSIDSGTVEVTIGHRAPARFVYL